MEDSQNILTWVEKWHYMRTGIPVAYMDGEMDSLGYRNHIWEAARPFAKQNSLLRDSFQIFCADLLQGENVMETPRKR